MITFAALHRLVGNTPLLAIDIRYRGEPRRIYAKHEVWGALSLWLVSQGCAGVDRDLPAANRPSRRKKAGHNLH